MVALLWELAEHIAQMINWSREESNDGLKRWLAWRRWVRTGRNKSLGASEGLGEFEAFGLVNVLAEKWKIVLLLFFDVLGEI